MILRRTLPFLFAFAVVGFASQARAQGLFDQGRISVGVQLGAGSAYDQTYFLLGARVGYFVLPGLELGVTGDTWIGNSPNITRLAPELRYVLDIVDVVKPYVGAFFRHWWIGDGFRDQNTAGGRAGLAFVQGNNAAIYAGAAYERVVSQCTDNCSYWYPEIGIALSF